MEENRLYKEKYLILSFFTKHMRHYILDIVEKLLIVCNITFLLNNFLSISLHNDQTYAQ